MSLYKFIPNSFAKEAFDLRDKCYYGDSMTDMLASILGDDTYGRYMLAQDPLYDGRKIGKIRIILCGHDPAPKFATIGTIIELLLDPPKMEGLDT